MPQEGYSATIKGAASAKQAGIARDRGEAHFDRLRILAIAPGLFSEIRLDIPRAGGSIRCHRFTRIDPRRFGRGADSKNQLALARTSPVQPRSHMGIAAPGFKWSLRAAKDG